MAAVLVRSRPLLALLLLALAAGACAPLNGDDDDDGASGDDDDDGATTSTPAPTPTMPSMIDLPATDATVTLPFRIGVAGTAQQPGGWITLTDGVGTVTLDASALAAAAYMTTTFDGFGYTLYQGFAVGASRWDVFWIYCDTGGNLDYLWDEGVTGPELFYVSATGTCDGDATPTSATVSFPAVTLTAPSPIDGFTITGPDVVLENGAAGILWHAGTMFPFVPFQVVDCSACGTPGWQELHSIAWDAANTRAVFAILYLIDGSPDTVTLAYARSLPDFADPFGTLVLDASWTMLGPTAITAPHALPRPRPF